MSAASTNISNPINPANLFSAKGLVIVITGGGTGIGLAFTAALAQSGASKIFVLGRRASVLEAAAAATDPSIVSGVECDVSSLESVQAAAGRISEQTSFVDVLINNAGITGPYQAESLGSAGSIEEVSAALVRDWSLWDPTWRTNTAAVVAVAAAFLPLLHAGNVRRGWTKGNKEGDNIRRRDDPDGKAKAAGIDPDDRRSSQIVTVASIAAFNREVTAGLAYTASKAGAVALGKSMANLLAPWGIRSNMIAPGRFPSEMTAGAATEFPVEAVPHGTLGTFEDLASLILYLVGPSGAYINGAVQTVDGGRLSVMPATN